MDDSSSQYGGSRYISRIDELIGTDPWANNHGLYSADKDRDDAPAAQLPPFPSPPQKNGIPSTAEVFQQHELEKLYWLQKAALEEADASNSSKTTTTTTTTTTSASKGKQDQITTHNANTAGTDLSTASYDFGDVTLPIGIRPILRPKHWRLNDFPTRYLADLPTPPQDDAPCLLPMAHHSAASEFLRADLPSQFAELEIELHITKAKRAYRSRQYDTMLQDGRLAHHLAAAYYDNYAPLAARCCLIVAVALLYLGHGVEAEEMLEDAVACVGAYPEGELWGMYEPLCEMAAREEREDEERYERGVVMLEKMPKLQRELMEARGEVGDVEVEEGRNEGESSAWLEGRPRARVSAGWRGSDTPKGKRDFFNRTNELLEDLELHLKRQPEFLVTEKPEKPEKPAISAPNTSGSSNERKKKKKRDLVVRFAEPASIDKTRATEDATGTSRGLTSLIGSAAARSQSLQSRSTTHLSRTHSAGREQDHSPPLFFTNKLRRRSHTIWGLDIDMKHKIDDGSELSVVGSEADLAASDDRKAFVASGTASDGLRETRDGKDTASWVGESMRDAFRLGDRQAPRGISSSTKESHARESALSSPKFKFDPKIDKNDDDNDDNDDDYNDDSNDKEKAHGATKSNQPPLRTRSCTVSEKRLITTVCEQLSEAVDAETVAMYRSMLEMDPDQYIPEVTAFLAGMGRGRQRSSSPLGMRESCAGLRGEVGADTRTEAEAEAEAEAKAGALAQASISGVDREEDAGGDDRAFTTQKDDSVEDAESSVRQSTERSVSQFAENRLKNSLRESKGRATAVVDGDSKPVPFRRRRFSFSSSSQERRKAAMQAMDQASSSALSLLGTAPSTSLPPSPPPRRNHQNPIFLSPSNANPTTTPAQSRTISSTSKRSTTTTPSFSHSRSSASTPSSASYSHADLDPLPSSYDPSRRNSFDYGSEMEAGLIRPGLPDHHDVGKSTYSPVLSSRARGSLFTAGSSSRRRHLPPLSPSPPLPSSLPAPAASTIRETVRQQGTTDTGSSPPPSIAALIASEAPAWAYNIPPAQTSPPGQLRSSTSVDALPLPGRAGITDRADFVDRAVITEGAAAGAAATATGIASMGTVTSAHTIEREAGEELDPLKIAELRVEQLSRQQWDVFQRDLLERMRGELGAVMRASWRGGVRKGVGDGGGGGDGDGGSRSKMGGDGDRNKEEGEEERGMEETRERERLDMARVEVERAKEALIERRRSRRRRKRGVRAGRNKRKKGEGEGEGGVQDEGEIMEVREDIVTGDEATGLGAEAEEEEEIDVDVEDEEFEHEDDDDDEDEDK